MASLQELRKRLKSIRATGQMAGAMRTAATAKYARVGRIREDFGPYARACRDMSRLLGGVGVFHGDGLSQDRPCFVLLGGNRGMCGGFNAELARFAEEQIASCRDPLVLVCGRRTALMLRDRHIGFEEFDLPDIPDYEALRPLTQRLLALYGAGQIGSVTVIYQHFRNMLAQEPAAWRLLPENNGGEEAPDAQPLYLPDPETIGRRLAESCFAAGLYDLALENAAGAQAATLMAMRSACDNAEAAAAELEVNINRRRQAEVTASVIETAGGNYQ